MKKALSLLAAVSFLVGVGTAAFAGGQKEAAASSGKVKLSLYNYVDVSTAEYTTFKEVVSKFEAKYPNIQLSIQNLFNDPYHQKLQAMAVAGNLPDVMFLWPTARTGYVTGRGLVKDLTPLLGDKKADFDAANVAPQGPDGQIWELPTVAPTDTTVVYTNDALLQKLGLTYPKTLSDLLAQSATINNAGLTPIAIADKDGWEMESCVLSTIVGRLGGNDWLPNAIAGKNGASFSDPQFVNSLKIVDQMAKAKLFPAGVAQMDYDQGLQLFEQQKAVYLIDGSWRVQNLEKDLSPEVKANISLNTVPALPGEVVQKSVADIASTGYGMNAKLKGATEKAAWDWIWFNAGPDGAAINLAHGLIPSYNKIDLSSSNLGPLTKKLVAFLNDTPGTNTVLDGLMNAKVIGVLNPDLQVMILGQKAPQQVAQDVVNWYQQNPSSN